MKEKIGKKVLICIFMIFISSFVFCSKSYAKVSKYTIRFNNNGGTGSMDDITGVKATEERELTANAFKRNGYVFKGWALSKNGKKEYNNKAKVKGLSEKDGAVVTLYAVWRDGILDIIKDRNIGKTLTLSREGEHDGDKSKLMWNSHLYCFQHEKSCDPDTYTVQAYVEIDGEKATRYYSNEDKTGKTVTDNANLGLGYILQYGDFDKGYFSGGRQTLRQRALWKYGDTWISNVGSSFNMSWTTSGITKSTDSYDDEKNYTYEKFANDAGDYAAKGAIPDADITFNKNEGYLNTTNDSVFGPFKVSFNSMYKITSISVTTLPAFVSFV